jgi:hypothetical protein
MASVPIQNSPQNLTMQDFRSVSERYGGLARSARFVARITPSGSLLVPQSGVSAITRDLMYLCDIVDVPGREIGTQSVHYYGPDLKYPVQTAFGDFDMTFICRNGSFEREFFDNWMTLINPPSTYDFNYIDEYTAEIDIFTFADHAEQSQSAVSKDPGGPSSSSTSPVPNYNITIHRAFPIIVHQQPSTWADGEFVRLMVTFSYYNWTRKILDPVARTATGQGRSFTLVEGRNTGGR